MTRDGRTTALCTLLRETGYQQVRVQVAGHDGSIAVIQGVPLDAIDRLAALAPQVKALGFRYVTLELNGIVP